MRRLEEISDAFKAAWAAGQRPRIEEALEDTPAPERTALLPRLLSLELEVRRSRGEQPTLREYRKRFSEYATQVEEAFAAGKIAHGWRANGAKSTPTPRAHTPPVGKSLGGTLDIREFAGSPADSQHSSAPVQMPGERAGPLEDLGTYGVQAEELRDLGIKIPSPAPPTAPSDRTTSPSWPVIPDYDILGELGSGGMGVVYKARQRSLNRLVALKMIHTRIQDNPDLLARFKIEAEAVARLHDPHIVQIHELGDFEGSHFISLELLEGGSLKERLAGNLQPARQAAELVATLAEAMQAAHRADIVHRDLKPANILFTTDDVPKVTDFGLAKRVEKGSELTHTGAVLGTPNYMAPEQARGRVHEIGPATDIYSLGAILYEMLTGRPPFKGTTVMETIRQVAEEEPVSPSRLQPRVPRDLVTICLKCLAKEPHKRYPTAKALAEDLHRYLAGEPIRARRTSVVGRGLKWARRKPATALLLMVTMAALMGLTGAGLWYRDHLRDQQRREGERITELRTKNTVALFKAQDDLEQKEWGRAEATLSTVFAAIEHQRQLDDLRARSIILLEQARRGLGEQKAWREDRARFERFRQLRDEALLLDTDFTGLDLPSNVEATRQTARDALEIFAEKEPRAGWALAPLPSSFSIQEQAEVTEGCCELILVWAEAMARPLSATEEASRQASQALQILDLTAKLPPSARPTPRLPFAPGGVPHGKGGHGGGRRRTSASRPSPASHRIRSFLVWARIVQTRPLDGGHRPVRGHPGEGVRALLGPVSARDLRVADTATGGSPDYPQRLHSTSAELRLALLAARLRQ